MVWDGAQASALGTAPLAKFWVALEQNGPWGARAATESHLDPELGAELDRMCHHADGRLILIRRPGTHPDPAGVLSQVRTARGSLTSPGRFEGRPQRVYVAGGLSGRPWLLEADLAHPQRLTKLAWAALANGDLDTVQESLPELRASPGPVLMICSNSKRDVCCAVRGRPVALESAAQRPGQVWECSHTGGHRFAPTGVLLPHGQALGRLTAASAVVALDAAARDELPAQLWGSTYDRGRSHLSAAGQAAESTVRQQIQEPSLFALWTTAAPRTGDQDTEDDEDKGDAENAENAEKSLHCLVSHVDGRRWDVVVVREPRDVHLPESCGKAPVPTWVWDCVVRNGPS